MAPATRPKREKDDAGTSGVKRNHEEEIPVHGSVERPQRKTRRITSLEPDTWYTLRVPGSKRTTELYLCEERKGNVLGDRSPYPPEDGGHYLFHGTGQDAALNMIQTGIKLTEGKYNQDFSHGDGFYVHHDFKEAKSWAHEFSMQYPKNESGSRRSSENSRDHPAVLVFKPCKLEDYKHLAFVGENAESNWQDLVKYNRSGREKVYRLDESLERQFEMCHFVTGPISDGMGKKTMALWKPSGFQLPNNEQLCVRNEDLVKLFRTEFMESIIFYGDITDENQRMVKKILAL